MSSSNYKLAVIKYYKKNNKVSSENFKISDTNFNEFKMNIIRTLKIRINESEFINIYYDKKLIDNQEKLDEVLKNKNDDDNEIFIYNFDVVNQKDFDDINKINENAEETMILNNTILNLNKKLSQFEKIIIKQEDNIDLLNKKTTENEISNRNKKIELEKKELEKNQLLNIIIKIIIKFLLYNRKVKINIHN